jgi:hypothetical protein
MACPLRSLLAVEKPYRCSDGSFELPPLFRVNREIAADSTGFTLYSIINKEYRGPVGIIMINLGNSPHTVRRGDRIAQLVVAPVARARFEAIDLLPHTERGAGGFGSTG